MLLLFYVVLMKNDNLIIWVEMIFFLGGSVIWIKVFLRYLGILIIMNIFIKCF